LSESDLIDIIRWQGQHLSKIKPIVKGKHFSELPFIVFILFSQDSITGKEKKVVRVIQNILLALNKGIIKTVFQKAKRFTLLPLSPHNIAIKRY